MNIKMFTGGVVETNAYLVEGKEGCLAIDAPEGFLKYLQKEKIQVNALILTHGHWDHIWDAADIVEWAQCPVYYHRDDKNLITQPELMRNFGLPIELKAVQATKFLEQGEIFEFAPFHFNILHVPGHCPGSICLYEAKEAVLFGGDVLFAGGVGRWDLPGGSQQQLIRGIQEKLMVLPGSTQVHPGHGESTTIGEEKNHNPYLT
jgi:hydroxyacylglutathione hydrolase